MLTTDSLPRLQRVLTDLDLDGWLLFDFQGTNPIAVGMLGLAGMLTRRHIAFVPARGMPTALIPVIEPWPWSHWPANWERRPYAGWTELEASVQQLVAGKRIAMEYCPGNGIPHLDRVPAGAVEMVRGAGAEVVSSTDLVTAFHAAWTPDQLISHRRTAVTLSQLSREALALAGERARTNAPIAEHELRGWLVEQLAELGLVTDSLPIVAAGAHSADVHYIPSADRPRLIVEGDVLLIDVWAKEPGSVYADQTWMASLGPPAAQVLDVWGAVLAARDSAITMIRSHVERGESVRGAQVHKHVRAILQARGFGDYAFGRAGHSISQQLHGAGPNLDAIESRDDRLLVPGTACSVEPGVYIDGAFGIRSEVNLYIGEHEIVVTPQDYQRELAIL